MNHGAWLVCFSANDSFLASVNSIDLFAFQMSSHATPFFPFLSGLWPFIGTRIALTPNGRKHELVCLVEDPHSSIRHHRLAIIDR